MSPYTLKLKGLSCAHCAKSIEAYLTEKTDFQDVRLDFLSGSLILKSSYDINTTISKIDTSIKLFEDNITVLLDTEEEEEEDNKENQIKIIKFAVGATIFLAAALAPMPTIASLTLYLITYVIFGKDVILKAFSGLFKKNIFDENFLMTISTLGAFYIGEYGEGVLVMMLFYIGDYFENLAVKGSKKKIKGLKSLKPDFARVLQDDSYVEVKPQSVSAGDIFLCKPGEKIALDGIITDGTAFVDTKALTGEPEPQSKSAGDSVLAGFIVLDGALKIRAEKEFSESSLSKVISLVETGEGEKAPVESFITRFAKYYTPTVVLLAILITIVPCFFTGFSDFNFYLKKGLVFLIVSCPCALVLSVPLTLFSGIGACSSEGILIKGSAYLDMLAKVKNVIFDKTGTLTTGEFKVTDVVAINNGDKDEIIRLAYMLEKNSNHPIANSIVQYHEELFGKNNEALAEFKDYAGLGVKGKWKDEEILIGNLKFLKSEGIEASFTEDLGIFVVKNKHLIGYIVISDTIKDGAWNIGDKLKSVGVNNVYMMSGDSEKNVKDVASKLGLSQYFYSMLPEDKFEKLSEIMKSENGLTSFVGDGINDAPCILKSDVGISMGQGSDLAIDKSHVVFLASSPEKLVKAIQIGKNTKRILNQNIVFSLGIKFLVLALSIVTTISLPIAIFADVGVSLLAVLNAIRRKV